MTEPDFQTTSSSGSRSSETSTLKETTMKKILVGMTALLLSLHAAAAPKSDSADKLGKDIAVFYKNPSAERAASLMDQIVKANLMRNTTLVWGTQALQKYPQGSTIWCDNIRTYQGDALTFSAYTLALTGTSQAQTCLDSLTLNTELKNNLKENKSFHPLQEPIISPASLDFHWVTYFATGNPKAVERIVDYIIKAQTAAAQRPNHVDLTLSAAIWSTRSNMQQDTAIDEIVRKYIQKQSEANKKRLEKALLAPQGN
jgi:hypothetical protein